MITESLPPNAKPIRPGKLYKFRAMNDYTKTAIADRQIYLSSPSQFNDPFEFRFRGEVQKEAGPEAWQKMWENGTGLTDDQLKHVKALTPEQVARVTPWVVGQYQEQLERECGVFSLAEDRGNLLMWAHYADMHKGICLEFDTSIVPFDADLHQVIYQEALPVLAMPVVDFEAFADSVLLGKSSHWRYEQEWRLVRQKIVPGERVLAYRAEAFTGVILGARFPQNLRPDLDAWIAASGAKPQIYRARQSQVDYAINIKLEKEEILRHIFMGEPMPDGRPDLLPTTTPIKPA
ncbi:MAG: DUF2971 domain-containing protein [Pseudomonadota bacterium]